MKTPSCGCSVALTTLSLLYPLAASGADPASAVKEPGDLWEVTSQMSMEGMPMAMPAQTQRVCAPRNWTEPPGGNADKTCQTQDFKSTPTSTTWKIRCAGPPAMTGEGAITRSGPDAYKGTIKFNSDDGVMTMNLSGRRVGDCDSGESKRQAAQIVAHAEKQQRAATAQAADVLGRACNAPVQSMDLRQMHMQESFCTDPAVKAGFCDRLGTEEGFKLVCERRADAGNGLSEIAAYCAKDADALTKRFCDQALEKESLDLLGKCCSVQARALALRECAGRKYTALAGSKYQSFCVSYARDVMAGGR